jgi:hypothetical protein
MPRFEKGSSPRLVAEKVLEAAVSDNPKTRYLVGEDALRMMERRKNASDEEFRRMVMNSVQPLLDEFRDFRTIMV